MLVMAVKQLYIVWAAVVFNPMTMEAIRPKAWWNPVFHCSIVGAAAIIVLTRLGRNSAFWIGAGLISIFCCVFAIVLGALCLHKSG
jgi:hypothetical protein